MTEIQLVEELKQGNESHLSYLYHYLPDVRKFILHNKGDEDDAKDLLQEAIIIIQSDYSLI